MSLPETYIAGFHDENAVKKMKYTKFGNTDMTVSTLSLGTAGFCSLYGNYSLDECKQIANEALKKGINYIDTAPYYGQGVSEEILGKCLKDIPRKAYYIATKLGRYNADLKTRFDFSAKRTRESIDVSLSKLGLDYVDVIQVHDIDFTPTVEYALTETLPAVEEIVKSGKARYIGITGYSLSVLKEVLSKSKIKIDVVLTYARQTMADDTLTEYIPFLKSKNLAIVSAAPHALGLLSSNGPQPWHMGSKELQAVFAEAREYCQQQGVEIGRLALYHALQIPGHHTNLVGMNTVKVLRESLIVVQEGITAKEKEVYQEVLKILKKLRVKHWENVELEEYWTAVKGK